MLFARDDVLIGHITHHLRQALGTHPPYAAVLTEHGCSGRDAQLLADLGMSALLAASADRMSDTSSFRELVLGAAEDQYRLITDSREPTVGFTTATRKR